MPSVFAIEAGPTPPRLECTHLGHVYARFLDHRPLGRPHQVELAISCLDPEEHRSPIDTFQHARDLHRRPPAARRRRVYSAPGRQAGLVEAPSFVRTAATRA